ncbi:MAG: MgtC/SapB family protein [Calditerrivibrio sp.]|nr:MgtC/SapB family protein [Calditerrivibrio sp.]
MENYIDLIIAMGLALLIGLERGWHYKDEDEGKRIAGIRTFAITGIYASISTYLALKINIYIFLVAFLSFAFIMAVIFSQGKREEDRGITTEISLLATFIISASAAFGYRYVSSASAVIMVLLLSLKPQIHSFLKRIDFAELLSLFKFLVLIAVIYPLLPDKPLGNWTAIKYTDIFKVVIVLSFISFAGYVMIKLAGSKKGVFLSSILGGLVSSTAVTINLSNFYRENENNPKLYIYGILSSWAVMFLRVIVLVTIFSDFITLKVGFIMISMVVSILISIMLMKKEVDRAEGAEIVLKNPMDLASSIKFALLLTFIIFLAEKSKELFGSYGLVMISIISGISDVDAITIYLSKLSQEQLFQRVAVLGIYLAVMVNTVVKTVIVFYIGGSKLGVGLVRLSLLTIIVGSLVTTIILYL